MEVLEPLVIQGLSHSVKLGISFLLRYNLKMLCTEEEVALMPVKDGLALRARLVNGGCHSFLSKRSVTVLQATKDQMISTQVWRIPRVKISINALTERLKEAVRVYAKDDCSIPVGMGKYIPVQTNCDQDQ